MYFVVYHYKYKGTREGKKMIKNKMLLIFIATLFLNFNLNNKSFAIEDNGLQNKYPDYAYEFAGKDTCENFNRKIFIFNSKVNKYIIRPVNIVWASVMPKYGMKMVQNFYTNIEFPIRLTSCLLQKDFKGSKIETKRFLTNTTLGVGGLYDTAKTRFHMEARQEDMGQVLAYHHVKQGPYLVLPVVASGNVRDIAGQVLDCPLNPTSYVIGPIALAAKSLSLVNKTTYLQSLVKAIDYTYADPYDITKKLQCVDKYIKNSNIDRSEVLAEKVKSQNIIAINNIPNGLGLTDLKTELKADIELKNYNPQDPLIDAMRTALFENKKIDDSIWSEMSVWNKSFSKQIKTSSVSVTPNHPNYKYRYILQKDKTAPLAIIYPSFGEGIMSNHSIVLAKIFYDEGYSVVIQGSAFQWEFIKSMPDDYKPGYPAKDANYAKIVTSKILANLEGPKAYIFNNKVLVGTSFGALTTLFVAAQEESENTLGISKYISICPPVEVLFALKQVDKYSQDWKNNPSDIKMRAAVTAEKIIQISQNITEAKPETPVKNENVNIDKNTNINMVQNKSEFLPFTDDEAKLIVGFIMKQKLSDLVFTIENGSKSKKSDIYESINNMSFYDYAQKYLMIGDYKSTEQLNYDTSLASLTDFLQTNKKYKIYHTMDDYYVNPEQLIWLKKQSNDKSVFFNNGSHLGFLYRKEFLDEFKKDIKLQKNIEERKV